MMMFGIAFIFVAGTMNLDDQIRTIEQDTSPIVDASAARTSDVSEGRVGQRQSRQNAAASLDSVPMARINSRISNRVQSRLRSRIDRNYDPQANARAPFQTAADQIGINPARR